MVQTVRLAVERKGGPLIGFLRDTPLTEQHGNKARADSRLAGNYHAAAAAVLNKFAGLVRVELAGRKRSAIGAALIKDRHIIVADVLVRETFLAGV